MEADVDSSEAKATIDPMNQYITLFQAKKMIFNILSRNIEYSLCYCDERKERSHVLLLIIIIIIVIFYTK